MLRLTFILLLLTPLASKAQYSQSDLFEHIEVPEEKDDFESILNFVKQFNAIQDTDLLKLDSILFYQNDQLKYTYYIADLQFFQRNLKLADSVLRTSTDSVYNKDHNSFDFYFTDIDKNRKLDSRHYLNSKGKYFKAEQFSEGNIVVNTTWEFDQDDHIIKETNHFIDDSSTYEMSYQRNKSEIIQRHAKVKTNETDFEYIIDYNSKGGIVGYKYFDHKSPKAKHDEIKITRDKTNRARKIKGTINDKRVEFSFSYLKSTTQITRKNAMGTSVFKLVPY